MPLVDPDMLAQKIRQTHWPDLPVDHVIDAANRPAHARDYPLFIPSASGSQVSGKFGDDKFTASVSDLFNGKGQALPVVPVYSDRIAAGRVMLPYSGQMFDTHGGVGFGAHPDRYGRYAWSVGHNTKSGYGKPSGPGLAWQRNVPKLADGRGGVLGAVWLGSNDSHLGNVTLMHAMQHELAWMRQNDPNHYALVQEGFARFPHLYPGSSKIKKIFGASGLKWQDLDQFLRHSTGESVPMGDRYEAMKEFMDKQIYNPHLPMPKGRKTVDVAGSAFSNFIKKVNDSIVDYRHIPKGHVVGLVKFSGEPLVHDMDAHPAYKHVMPGTYLGELQRTVPLADLIPQIRIGPIKSGAYVTDLFMRDNPYHAEVPASVESLMRPDVLSKSLRLGNEHVSEMNPEAVNLLLMKHMMQPVLQKMAFQRLLDAVRDDSGRDQFGLT